MRTGPPMISSVFLETFLRGMETALSRFVLL